MPDFEVIDWEETTIAERKLLHKQVLTLKKRLRIDWTTTFQQAFGPRDNVGSNYEDNLRQGKIAPERAYKLFIWLYKQDRVLASNVEDDILALRAKHFPEQSINWEAMLAKGKFSNVRACKCDDVLGMAEFARRQPIQSLKFKLLEEFYFEFDIPFDGTLIAFQGYKGIWYPQLIAEDTAILKVSEGNQIIPSDDTNKPDPLWEETDRGKHSYAFLLTQDSEIDQFAPPIAPMPHGIPVKTRDALAQQIMGSSDKAWELFRINLMFS